MRSSPWSSPASGSVCSAWPRSGSACGSLRALGRGRADAGGTAQPGRPVGTQALAVGAVTLANGGDNVAVYTPLFATRGAGAVTLLVGVFAVMMALWLLAAHALVRHPALGPPIRRIGRYALPLVLIGLGILIVAEATR